MVPDHRREQGRGRNVDVGTDDKPLLVLDRVGKGRVAEILSIKDGCGHAVSKARPQTELLRRLPIG